MTDELPRGWIRLRWVLIAVGALAGAYGTVFLLVTVGGNVIWWAVFVGAGVILHDGIVAPAAAAVGHGLRRLPGGAYLPVVAGLVLTGMVVAVAWPFALRLGYSSLIPSALPRNYGQGLLVTLVAVWVGVALVALVRMMLGRRQNGAVAGDVAAG